MGRWDFKTTPGWHWESIKPGGQARFRVKDSWIEETPAAKYPGLALLAAEKCRPEDLSATPPLITICILQKVACPAIGLIQR